MLFKESSISIVCTISDFFSGLWIAKISSVNYVLHFGRANIHKHCLYWSVFSTDINGKIIFNCLLLFKPFLLVKTIWVESVNSTIFFWHAQKLREGVYLRDFSIVICGKLNSNFPVLFLVFFHLVLKFLKSFFYSLFIGQWIVWVEPLISEMSRILKMNLYLKLFSIAIYQKFRLYYLCLFRHFSGLQILQFWSVNYASYFRPS